MSADATPRREPPAAAEEWDGPRIEYRFIQGRTLPQSAYKGLGNHGWILATVHATEEGKKEWVFWRYKN